MLTIPASLSSLRQPEYTGENRCIPCTVVNEVIAAGLAVAAALLVRSVWGATPGLVAGGAVFAVGSLAVYLRGYLVPKTPALTKRYLPDRVLALFDKEPPVVADSPGAGVEEPDFDLDFEVHDPEEVLRAADAIEPCAEHDLCLTADFESALLANAEALAGGEGRAAAVADLFDADDGVRLETESGRPVAYDDDGRLNGWPSEVAFLSDLGAHRALSDRDGPWDEVAPTQRLGILQALRGFLTSCPDCGGDVGMTDDTVESCCRSWDVVAVRCHDCGAHFMELDPGNFEDQVANEVPSPTEGGFTR